MKLKVPNSNCLFVVSAPSGGGKTSLIKEALKESPCLKLSVSHTTRRPRPAERCGRDYHFVDRASFAQMIKHNEFLEYAEVFGEYYGTARRFIDAELTQGNDVVMEIDWQGARQIRARCRNTFSIFILPPSPRVLAARLQQRAQDSAAVIAQRMNAALSEMQHYSEYDYVIINDDFAAASAELSGLLARQSGGQNQQRVRHAINNLGLDLDTSLGGVQQRADDA